MYNGVKGSLGSNFDFLLKMRCFLKCYCIFIVILTFVTFKVRGLQMTMKLGSVSGSISHKPAGYVVCSATCLVLNFLSTMETIFYGVLHVLNFLSTMERIFYGVLRVINSFFSFLQ